MWNQIRFNESGSAYGSEIGSASAPGFRCETVPEPDPVPEPNPVPEPDAEPDSDAELDPELYAVPDAEPDPDAEPYAVPDANSEPEPNPEPDPDVFKCQIWIRTFSIVGSGQKSSGSASTPRYAS
jgi:hypothetical protein